MVPSRLDSRSKDQNPVSPTRAHQSRTVLATSSAISSSSSNANANANTNANPNTPAATNTSSDALRNAMAGAMAGIFSRTMTAPIERVKLVLQLQRTSSALNSPSNSSVSTSSKSNKIQNSPGAPSTACTNNQLNAWKVCHQIYTTEGGLWAFWRGNAPNVLRQAGASALNFMLMDCYKATISPIMDATLTLSSTSNRTPEAQRKDWRIFSSFLSGGLAGGTTTTFLYPIEFMRTRLALDVGSSRMYPKGMRDVFGAIWKTDGIRGIYQGYGIALTGVVIYRALHLGGYDACKIELLHRRRGRSSDSDGVEESTTITMGERFAIAQIVSITAGTICYPIDSVRRRLMMQAGQPIDARKYVNSIDAFRKIFKTEGIRGFYLGLGPNIVRSVAGALLLVSYDVFGGRMAAT